MFAYENCGRLTHSLNLFKFLTVNQGVGKNLGFLCRGVFCLASPYEEYLAVTSDN